MPVTLPDLPSPLTFGTVTGRFLSVLADSSDAGLSPDAVALDGNVTITPNVASFRLTGPNAATVVTTTINATVVGGNLLGPDGVTPLRLLATDSPNVSPTPVQYTAKFALKNVTNQPPSVVFNVLGNGTVDISSIIPASPAAAVVTVVSEESRIAAEAAATRAEAAAAEASSKVSAVTISQADYNALTTPDPATLYLIVS